MIHSCCAPIRTDRQGRELLKHGSIDFPIACYHDDLSAQKCDWHWHDELELLVVSEGSAIVSAATHKYHLHTGQGAFINSAILHEVYAASDVRCYPLWSFAPATDCLAEGTVTHHRSRVSCV